MKRPHAKIAQRTPQLPITPDEIQSALQDDVKLSEVVSKILTLNSDASRSLIGKTTTTAYRRVHEIVTSTLDRLHERVRVRPDEAPRFLVDLSKCLILVKYQQARDQLSEPLSKVICNVLDNIINRVKEKATNLTQIVERARMLLDAIAVLVYKYAR